MFAFLPTLALALGAQLPAAPETPYAIVGVRVLDAEAGVLREDWTVLVQGERILAAGPRLTTLVPSDAVTLPGAGRILAPGLFDAHVHLTDPAVQGRAMLANGVVFARDLGSATDAAISLREELRSGATLGPELIVVGAIIDGAPPVWPFSEACADAASARAAVTKLADAGVDQIKLYSLLSPEAFHAAMAEAKARGLTVGGHVPNAVSLDEALAAGFQYSEHLTGWERLIGRVAGVAPDEIARGDHREMAYWSLRTQAPKEELTAAYARAAQSGCFFSPTLVVLEGVSGYSDPDAVEKEPLMAYVSPYFRGFWRSAGYQRAAPFFAQALPHQKALVKDLHDAGVTLVCGTDLANPRVYPGFSLHREMELFQECGIAPADVIRSATTIPARLCGVSDRLGRITAGATASFLMLSANPLEDVKNYAAIEAVVLRGRHFNRAALDEMLAGARAAAAGTDATSPASESDFVQKVPGAIVHRGRYSFKFAGNPAGHEDFLWTKDGEDWHLQASLVPSGGFTKPCDITAHYGADRKLKAATWSRPDGKESATYRLEGDRVFARGGSSGAESEVEIALEGAAFSPDAFSAEWLNYQALDLQPGAALEDRLFGFGMESWKPIESARKLKRDPDAEVPWQGGKVLTSVYSSDFVVNGQAMKARTWLDANGLPLKVAFSFAFGKFEAVRVAD